jgi:hypothetical protein
MNLATGLFGESAVVPVDRHHNRLELLELLSCDRLELLSCTSSVRPHTLVP